MAEKNTIDPHVDMQQNHVLLTNNLNDKALFNSPMQYDLNQYQEARDPEVHGTGQETISSSNTKVLVVDDNFFCGLSVTTQLKQYQIEYDMATDGQEGFDMVRNRFNIDYSTYKLIIMDVYMPICDGFKSAKLIRDFLKEKEQTGLSIAEQPYICFLTAQFQTVSQMKAELASVNCNQVLTKPIFKNGIQQLLLRSGILRD